MFSSNFYRVELAEIFINVKIKASNSQLFDRLVQGGTIRVSCYSISLPAAKILQLAVQDNAYGGKINFFDKVLLCRRLLFKSIGLDPGLIFEHDFVREHAKPYLAQWKKDCLQIYPVEVIN